jgi:hypothetical protein
VITEKGAAALAKIGAVPEGLLGQNLVDFLRLYEPKCPKCHRAVKSVIEVKRYGKYGQVYDLVRLRHTDRRKKDGRAYCYIGIV